MNARVSKYMALDFCWGTGAVAAVTGAALLLQKVTGYWAISLVYLLSVVLLALVLNRWAVLFVATLSALLWNYLFIPPRFTFHIASFDDVMMFGMYFIVAVAMGHLTHQLRVREATERRREQRTSALNRLLQSLAASTTLDDGLAGAVTEMDALFEARTAILLDEVAHCSSTLAAAALAGDPSALRLSLPTARGSLGTLGIQFRQRKVLMPGEQELLETFASQIAMFIERHRLIETAQHARVAQESERLHRTLLDSVSHELKTPLATIQAATEGLENQLQDTPVPLGGTFVSEIKAANRRLNRIVGNLLEMTRIEAVGLPLRVEWCDVTDLLESAADQLANEVGRERLRIEVPTALPLVRLDFGLMEQALCNLLLNAAEHSPSGSPIRMSAQIYDGHLELCIADQGTGLLPGEEKKVFEKFYRGPGSKPGGTGLGLSIVQGIARAHRAVVSASNNAAGGATFRIRVPVETREQPL